MFCEPAFMHPTTGQGVECLTRKVRPTSLQLKPLSFVTPADLTYTLKSPLVAASFEAKVFMRTVTSPFTPRFGIDYSQPTRVTENAPKPCPSIINSLPNEILSLIFEDYLLSPQEDEVDIDTIPSVSSDFTSSPLTLTHVCKHWRTTAIAHKMLWSSIAVSIKPHSLERGKNLVRLLRLFLSRANGTPLSLSLASHNDCDYMSQEEVALAYAAIQLFTLHANRWRNVHFQLYNEELQRALSNLLSKSKPKFPELRSLTLDVTNDAGQLYEAIFRNAPNLSHLVIDDDLLELLDQHSLDAAVPWSKLKSLEITCNAVPAKRLLAICGKAVNLETLSVWRVAEEEDDDDESESECSTAQVTMRSLRDLKVTFLSHLEDFLTSLSLPLVEKVDFDLQGLAFRAGQKVPLHSLLKPVEQLLENSDPKFLQSLQYRIKSQCLSDLERQASQSLQQSWCGESGFKKLAGVRDLRIELYKY